MSKRTRIAQLKAARYHAECTVRTLEELSLDVDAEQQLGIAVKALRHIANANSSDDKSRGIAHGALKRLRLL